MSTQNNNEKKTPKLSPEQELKKQELSQELQPLSEIATEIAGTKKETGKNLTTHKTQVQYKLLASNEMMVVEEMTPEKMFSLAKFSDEKIAGFQTLNEGQKQNILTYFAEGYNPNLTLKQIKKLANNLYYFYADKNEKMKRINNPNLENIRNGISLEATGKSIEDVLTTHGTQFSDEGREIDKLRDQMLDENIRKNQEITEILRKINNLLNK